MSEQEKDARVEAAADTVQLVGVKADGSEHALGTIRMPANMKAREIVRELLGPIDEEAGNDAAIALWACERLLKYVEGAKPALAPAPADAAQASAEGEAVAVANGRGIYVASRASAPERPAMWRALRDAGWPIVSSWIDESGEGETASFTELWARIESEIRGSSGVILYAETEDFPLKGAYIEAGIALGAGLPVAVVLPGVPLQQRSDRPIGSWIRHPRVTICGSLEEARASLAQRPAMVALTDERIEWATAHLYENGKPVSPIYRVQIGRAAIAEFCRVNGITSPKAQEGE